MSLPGGLGKSCTNYCALPMHEAAAAAVAAFFLYLSYTLIHVHTPLDEK